jgi:hypothetical protein
MSSSPEATPPQDETTITMPEEPPFVQARGKSRAWLRAGVLFGGTLTWATAVFGAMAEHGLWTGASAGFGLVLVLVVVYVLSIRSAYESPARSVRQVLTRAVVTILGGGVMWSMFVFITLVLCERSALGAMLVLGVFGMLATFMVVGLFGRKRSGPRHDPSVRAVRALAWITVLLVSVTALFPPFAEAMARRARRGHDATGDGVSAASVGDDD